MFGEAKGEPNSYRDSTVEAETSRRQESFKRKARSNFGCFCLALALFKRFVYFMCIGVMPVCMSI